MTESTSELEMKCCCERRDLIGRMDIPDWAREKGSMALLSNA